MEDLFQRIASPVAVLAEAAAVLIVALGVIQALVSVVKYLSGRQRGTGARKEIWMSLALWLLLALEFELAADIVRSVITPSWTDIGRLAAIGVVRTLLNYFLEKDLEKYGEASGVPHTLHGIAR